MLTAPRPDPHPVRRSGSRRPPTVLVLLTALALVALGFALPVAGSAAPAAPAAIAAPVRIMPLGDSITGSPGCWRALLWNDLRNAGYTNIDFVGTLGPQGCGVSYDGDNEGHGGFLATNVAAQNQLPAWLAATLPDIVLMHFGTNDVWSNRSPASILAAFSTLVDQMRVSNPRMKVLVAKIIPMAPPTCPECGARVVAFNDAIPGWAATKTTAQSPVVVVDQWTGFSTTTDTYDGVHQNATGDRKMANRWYGTLAPMLSGATPTPTATPTTSPTASPTTSPTAVPTSTTPPPNPGGCTATHTVVNQWQGGFQGEVVVRNTGTVAISGWTVTITYPNGQRITQAWNATVAQNGATATATSISWNALVMPGASTSFGFLASWAGTNGPPTLTCARH